MIIVKRREWKKRDEYVLSNLGSNHLARTTPGRVPVDKHNSVLGESLLELGGATERGKDACQRVVQFPPPARLPDRLTGLTVRLCMQNSLFNVVDSHLGQRGMERSRKSKSGSGRDR